MIQCRPCALVFPIYQWYVTYRNGTSHGIEMDVYPNTIPYVSNVHIYFKYHNPSKKKYFSKINEGSSSGCLRALVHRPFPLFNSFWEQSSAVIGVPFPIEPRSGQIRPWKQGPLKSEAVGYPLRYLRCQAHDEVHNLSSKIELVEQY